VRSNIYHLSTRQKLKLLHHVYTDLPFKYEFAAPIILALLSATVAWTVGATGEAIYHAATIAFVVSTWITTILIITSDPRYPVYTDIILEDE